MRKLATTKMSSKGQVVIPEEIRNQLGLHAGDQFIVVASDNVVILKIIEPPQLNEFDHLINDAQKKAKKAGLTKKRQKKRH